MAVKNVVTISLIIFITVVVVVLGAGVFSNQNKTATPILQQNNTQNNNKATAPATTYTTSDVAKHNTASDCWTIVINEVYNVTNLIPIHTGGSDKIVPFCGKDATNAFDNRNGMGPHSQRAQNALNNYYVGDLTR